MLNCMHYTMGLCQEVQGAPISAKPDRHGDGWLTPAHVSLCVKRNLAQAHQIASEDPKPALSCLRLLVMAGLTIRHAAVSADGQPTLSSPSAGVLRSIAQAGGAALCANGARSYEEAVQLCLAHLENASRATGDAYAGALGDLVAASKSPAALQAVRMISHMTVRCAGAVACNSLVKHGRLPRTANVSRCSYVAFTDDNRVSGCVQWTWLDAIQGYPLHVSRTRLTHLNATSRSGHGSIFG